MATTLLQAPTAAARRRKKRQRVTAPKLLKKLSLDQRTNAPTFAPAPLRTMNRGELLYYGKGLWAEQQTFYLLSLHDNKMLKVTAPFNAYVRKNPGMKVQRWDRRPMHEQFHITKLLYYDRRHQEAGFEVEDAIGGAKVRRHFLMQWDLKTNAISQATLVARSRSGQTYTHMLPLGYDSQRREFLYVRQVIGKDASDRTIFVIGFSSRKPRVVAQFEGKRSMSSKTYFDDVHHRALLVEYAELASKGPAPKGHLVDTVSGKVRHFPIPLTTYGVAFGAAGKRLYTYSAQLGQLWTIDAVSGAKLQSLKVGKLGHEIGRVSKRELLLLRNSGLRFLSLTRKGVRPGRWVPIKQIYTGFSHVGGSLVLPRRALVKNGDLLYIVEPRPAR
ncbi:MAG: hypothetical protein CSA65_02330 [Proteobacteria bacterium]|nr:MAG: hypothetical protein CSA65_02330 [Pseudomonadota bacterium]